METKHQATVPNPKIDRGRIACYELLGELSRGEKHVVYKAKNVQVERIVALKVLVAGASATHEEGVRFLNEVQKAAAFNHPNILQIYQVGEDNGFLFFSMEYAEGGSLDRKLGRKPIPPREAAQIVDTLARTMHHAHQHNIIHCDLKPAHILFAVVRENWSGTSPEEDMSEKPLLMVPKITDFSLARPMDREKHATGEVIPGTPSYMAPEQVLGRIRDIGPWTDVYALGAILYEALTGRPPLLGRTPTETIQQVLTVEPYRPRKWQPEVPRDLEAVVLQCLEKEPTRRYLTAYELAEDLGRWLRAEPVHAKTLSLQYRLGKFARLHRRWLLPIALLAIPAALIALVWFFLR